MLKHWTNGEPLQLEIRFKAKAVRRRTWLILKRKHESRRLFWEFHHRLLGVHCESRCYEPIHSYDMQVLLFTYFLQHGRCYRTLSRQWFVRCSNSWNNEVNQRTRKINRCWITINSRLLPWKWYIQSITKWIRVPAHRSIQLHWEAQFHSTQELLRLACRSEQENIKRRLRIEGIHDILIIILSYDVLRRASQLHFTKVTYEFYVFEYLRGTISTDCFIRNRA